MCVTVCQFVCMSLFELRPGGEGDSPDPYNYFDGEVAIYMCIYIYIYIYVCVIVCQFVCMSLLS